MTAKKVKIALILSVAFNISFLTTVVYTSWYQPMMTSSTLSEGRLHNKHLFLEKLGVSGAQQHDMMGEIQRFHSEIDQLNHSTDLYKEALVDEILSDKPDLVRIQLSIKGLSNLQKKLQELTVSHFLQLKKRLTKKQMENLMQQVKIAMKIGQKSNLF